MKERILWLDNLKGVLIFLVVLGHCLQFTSQNPDSDLLFNFIYSFHMPLFMFLSGYACFKLYLGFNIIKKRFVQLIIPFLSFNAINAILTGNNYLLYFIKPQTGLWFLWVLFFITVLQIAVSNVCQVVKLTEESLTFVTFVCFFVLSKALHLTYFGVDMIASFWLYYAIGYFVRKHGDLFCQKISIIFTIAIIVVFLIFSLTYNRSLVPNFISFIPHIIYI